MKKILSSKNFVLVVSLLGVYLITAGISWALFTYTGGGSDVRTIGKGLTGKREKIGEGLPKTEECPINGAYYSEPEREIWESRRPITAIIENHEDARPLEGLVRADVVYEAVAEGGVTRFLSVFYCGASAEDVRIAPIRSARVYFVKWAAEYADFPLFTHVGGANNICGNCPGGVKPKGQVDPQVRAIELLGELGWRVARGNDFDTTYDSGYPEMFRDQNRLGHPIALEHTVVSTTDLLFTQGAERGFSNITESTGESWDSGYTAWKFADDAPVSSPKTDVISFEFWSNKPKYDVSWRYDSGSNSYLRDNGGEPHLDLKTQEQVTAKNVIIQFVQEKGPVDSEKHMYYENVDEGDAIIFQNGGVVEATWEKESISDRTMFYDEDGDEIEFVRGVIWVEAVPIGNDIDY